MTFPIRYGETVRPVQLNYPLIPKLTIVNGNAPAGEGIDSMLAPFASSVNVSEQLSSKVTAETWVSTSLRSGSLRGVTTLEPQAAQMVAPEKKRIKSSNCRVNRECGILILQRVKYPIQIREKSKALVRKVNAYEKEHPRV